MPRCNILFFVFLGVLAQPAAAQTTCTGSIGRLVWNDANRNGVFDTGEPGLAVTVNLRNASGATVATMPTHGLSSIGGEPFFNYRFSGLCAGTYTVEVTDVGVYAGTTTATVVLPTDDASNQTVDFGLFAVIPAIDLSAVPRQRLNSVVGDSQNPRIDAANGDLVTYSHATDDVNGIAQAIRYYRFSTGVDQAIPAVVTPQGRSMDLISDVNAGRIVFLRVSPAYRLVIMLLDTTAPNPTPVEISPPSIAQPNGAPVIGGNSVVYNVLPLNAAGQEMPNYIVHYDVTTGVTTAFPNAGANDANPSVSPDGNVIVWQRCLTFTACDIMQAVRNGTGWNITPVATTPDYEFSPDTDGTLSVFTVAPPPGGTYCTAQDVYRIYQKPIAGGAVTRIPLFGAPQTAKVAGDVLALELRAVLCENADIYFQSLGTGQLYQATRTLYSNERAQDIAILPDGRIRLVWQSDVDGFRNNVYGATFERFKKYTDRNLFVQEAGTLSQINFDRDSCGAPISASSPGVLAGNLYSALGVNFQAGVIFDIAALGGTPPSAPNVITNSGINTPTPALVKGGFGTGVYAVGITNVGAQAVLRLFDGQGNLITTINTDANTAATDFVGVVSDIPIRSFEYDFVSGLGFGGDDLLCSTIAQGSTDCLPPTTTASTTPAPNAAGWSAGPVTVTLTASDNSGGLGVQEVRYSLAGAQTLLAQIPGSVATFSISAQGVTTVDYRAVDNAGNQESPKTLSVRIDTTAPQLTLPATLTMNATGPSGATVTYTAAATDNLDPAPRVVCSPVSGTLFPIGTTAVSCTASDVAGNAATGSFSVTVVGAPGQITNLSALVQSFNLPQGIENSLEAKFSNAQATLADGRLAAACSLMSAFIKEVQAQAGKSITLAQARQLIAVANNIKASLDCP